MGARMLKGMMMTMAQVQILLVPAEAGATVILTNLIFHTKITMTPLVITTRSNAAVRQLEPLFLVAARFLISFFLAFTRVILSCVSNPYSKFVKVKIYLS